MGDNDERDKKRPTKAQIEQRVKVVYELLLSDTTYTDTCRYVSDKWGLTSRTTDRYIQKAYALIVEEAGRIRQNALERHLAQRAFIRHKALKGGDKRLFVDILKDEAKLLDLYPAKQSSQVLYNVDVSKLTDEQLERIIKGEDPDAVFSTSDNVSAKSNSGQGSKEER